MKNNYNCKISKLTNMPYANACVRKYTLDAVPTQTILQSYITDVAIIDYDDNGDRWLEITGLYSATTRRHISKFMDEYTNLTYFDAKKIYNMGVKMNIETGEIVPVN